MPYILDGAVILIILIFVAYGYKKGILRTVLGILCFIIAFAAASVFSSPQVTESVYNRFFKDAIVNSVDNAVKNAKAEASQKIKSLVEENASSAIEQFTGNSELAENAGGILGDILDAAEEFIRNNPVSSDIITSIDIDALLTNEVFGDRIKEVINDTSVRIASAVNKELPVGIAVSPESIAEYLQREDTVKAFITEAVGDTSNGGSMAEYIESSLIRPVFLRALSMVIWGVVFAVSNIVLHVIMAVILSVRAIAPVKAADSFVGGVLGAAEGLIAVSVCAVILGVIITLTGGNEYINNDMIGQTIIFGRLYDLLISFLPSSVLSHIN